MRERAIPALCLASLLLALGLVSTAAAADNPFQDPFGDGVASVAPPPASEASSPADAAPLPASEATSPASEEKLPTIHESVRRKVPPRDVCPSPQSLKTIAQLSSDIASAKGDFPTECGLGQTVYQPRCWGSKTFTWTAAALCHRPLYFEDEQLERYGHCRRPLVQCVASPARFFLAFPILPYEMGVCPPRECIYTLGTYRPGDCSPCLREGFPLSVRAALIEAGAWTGAVFALP